MEHDKEQQGSSKVGLLQIRDISEMEKIHQLEWTEIRRKEEKIRVPEETARETAIRMENSSQRQKRLKK